MDAHSQVFLLTYQNWAAKRVKVVQVSPTWASLDKVPPSQLTGKIGQQRNIYYYYDISPIYGRQLLSYLFIFVWSDWYIGVMEMSSDNMSTEDMTPQWRCELLNFDEQNVKGGSSLDPWNDPPPPPTLLPSCMSRYFPISASAEKRLLSFSPCNCKTQPSNRPFWMSSPIFPCLSLSHIISNTSTYLHYMMFY